MLTSESKYLPQTQQQGSYVTKREVDGQIAPHVEVWNGLKTTRQVQTFNEDRCWRMGMRPQSHTQQSQGGMKQSCFFFSFYTTVPLGGWTMAMNGGMETPQMKKTRGGPLAAPRWCWRHETTRRCHGNCTWVGWGVLRRSRPRGIAAPGRLAWWTNRHVRRVPEHTQFTQIETWNFSLCSAARPQCEWDIYCKRAPWVEAKVNGKF